MGFPHCFLVRVAFERVLRFPGWPEGLLKCRECDELLRK